MSVIKYMLNMYNRQKNSILIFLLYFLLTNQIFTQWAIPLPETGIGRYAFNDTIYMSTSGQDSWPGTPEQPVKTFQKALQLLPFGINGIPNTQSYGLIQILPGTYFMPSGLQQGENQWKQGNNYKNVSIEGVGDVSIFGDPQAQGVIHGIRLMGNHFFIKNIKIYNYTGIGIFINRPVLHPDQPGPSHVLIREVTVDSTGSHGILTFNSDTIHVVKTRVLRSSRLNYDTQPQLSCTAWPSGLKFHFSKHIVVEDCEVAFTRGEGLNFHNCTIGIARHNRIHDNLTNLYNDNSSRLHISHNYIFNTPGLLPYASPCPQLLSQKRLSGTGILIGNEGSCADSGHSPSFVNCNTVQCGALLVPPYRFPTIDSIFIYNNIIHKCGNGIDIWQGDTNIIGPNCISNVFIFNNSIFEVTGDAEASGAQIKFFFPVFNFLLNSYGNLKNVVFHGNLFSFNSALHPGFKPYRQTFASQVSHDFTFQYNVWSETHDFLSTKDWVSNEIAIASETGDFEKFDACTTPALTKDVPVLFPWFVSDFSGKPRKIMQTQAGALERECTGSQELHVKDSNFSIHPNPAVGETIIINCKADGVLSWYNLDGKKLFEKVIQSPQCQFQLPELRPGIYLVSDGKSTIRCVILN